ncbi:hypothetical protein EBL84_15345, partial [Marichromatium sp. AB31]
MDKASGYEDWPRIKEWTTMMSLGIDVSKAKLHTALELSEQERVKLKTKTVPNTAAGVEALIDWLGRQGARPE